MKTKPLTLQQLEATWWWRQPEYEKELERIEMMGYLLAARNYELMRFAPEAKNYQTNFLRLDRESRTIAAMAWGKIVETPYKHNYDPWKIEAGWTNPQPPLQWNLRLSKRQLKKAFLNYIDQELKLQNLSAVTKLTGKKNRPATWGYVEFLGRRRNRIGNMEVHVRRIYDADARVVYGQSKPEQTVHEFDILQTEQLEYYFVLALFGVEIAINVGGPVIDGYLKWLQEHDGVSPLYYGKNDPSKTIAP